jgi:hypothetical protein
MHRRGAHLQRRLLARHQVDEHVFQVGLAHFHVFHRTPASRIAASSCSTSCAFCAGSCTMRPVMRACWAMARQHGVGLEAQHVARGRLQQFAGAVQRDHAALLEHRDAVAQRLGFFQVVGGQQHGAALLVELGDELPQRLAQLDVDTGGGLVEHDHRRLVHQRLRHQHAALHAARELAHVGRGLVGEAEAVQQLVDPGVVVLDAEVARLDAQRLAHVEEGVEHQLLRHDAELAARLGVVALHVEAVHADGAGRGARQPREHADQGGLAGAVGAEQAEELARLDLEVTSSTALGSPCLPWAFCCLEGG